MAKCSVVIFHTCFRMVIMCISWIPRPEINNHTCTVSFIGQFFPFCEIIGIDVAMYDLVKDFFSEI